MKKYDVLDYLKERYQEFHNKYNVEKIIFIFRSCKHKTTKQNFEVIFLWYYDVNTLYEDI